MSRPILFVDFDGTICTDRYWHSLSGEEQVRLQQALFVDNKPLAHAWMRGEKTSEEINQFLADTCSLDYGELWNTFVTDCKSFALENGVYEAIGEVRTRYRTVLVTDNMDCFGRFIVPSIKLDKVFDHIWNSSDHGFLKNDYDGRAYTEACHELGADISECVLIDDREHSIDTFAQLGGQTYLTGSPKDTVLYLNHILNRSEAL